MYGGGDGQGDVFDRFAAFLFFDPSTTFLLTTQMVDRPWTERIST